MMIAKKTNLKWDIPDKDFKPASDFWEFNYIIDDENVVKKKIKRSSFYLWKHDDDALLWSTLQSPICAISYLQRSAPSKIMKNLFIEPNIFQFGKNWFSLARAIFDFLPFVQFCFDDAKISEQWNENKHRNWRFHHFSEGESAEVRELFRHQARLVHWHDMEISGLLTSPRWWWIINHGRRWSRAKRTKHQTNPRHITRTFHKALAPVPPLTLGSVTEGWLRNFGIFFFAAFKLPGRLIFQHKGHVLCFCRDFNVSSFVEEMEHAVDPERNPNKNKALSWHVLKDAWSPV